MHTARLLLRGCVVDDFEPYAAMWADPRVTTFIGGAPRPRDEAWRRFCQGVAMWPLVGFGFWTVVRGAEFIGVAGFARFERGLAVLDGFPETGWAFVADAWGHGYAGAVVAALTGWADDAGLGETRCIIGDGNVASRRVANRTGYVAIGPAGEAVTAYARLPWAQP